MVHLYFNVIGTAFFLTVVYTYRHFGGFSDFWLDPINRGGIANFHTIFNIVVTVCFIPFSFVLEKLARLTIRDSISVNEQEKLNEDIATLDERFLKSPSLAIQQASKSVIQMGKYSQYNFREMRQLYNKFDIKIVDRIKEYEQSIDRIEDKLNYYLLQISELELSENENRNVTTLLHLVSEFERIGDYTINLVESAEEMYNKQISFSNKAKNEFNLICDAVDEIIELSITSTTFNDLSISYNFV